MWSVMYCSRVTLNPFAEESGIWRPQTLFCALSYYYWLGAEEQELQQWWFFSRLLCRDFSDLEELKSLWHDKAQMDKAQVLRSLKFVERLVCVETWSPLQALHTDTQWVAAELSPCPAPALPSVAHQWQSVIHISVAMHKHKWSTRTLQCLHPHGSTGVRTVLHTVQLQ
jgi:hypothetical protein